MNEDILNSDWENLIDSANDVDQACSNFTNTFITIAKQNIPNKTI